jgi:hypothetical protein
MRCNLSILNSPSLHPSWGLIRPLQQLYSFGEVGRGTISLQKTSKLVQRRLPIILLLLLQFLENTTHQIVTRVILLLTVGTFIHQTSDSEAWAS